jgi:hypothetical protein
MHNVHGDFSYPFPGACWLLSLAVVLVTGNVGEVTSIAI